MRLWLGLVILGLVACGDVGDGDEGMTEQPAVGPGQCSIAVSGNQASRVPSGMFVGSTGTDASSVNCLYSVTYLFAVSVSPAGLSDIALPYKVTDESAVDGDVVFFEWNTPGAASSSYECTGGAKNFSPRGDYSITITSVDAAGGSRAHGTAHLVCPSRSYLTDADQHLGDLLTADIVF